MVLNTAELLQGLCLNVIPGGWALKWKLQLI